MQRSDGGVARQAGYTRSSVFFSGGVLAASRWLNIHHFDRFDNTIPFPYESSYTKGQLKISYDNYMTHTIYWYNKRRVQGTAWLDGFWEHGTYLSSTTTGVYNEADGCINLFTLYLHAGAYQTGGEIGFPYNWKKHFNTSIIRSQTRIIEADPTNTTDFGQVIQDYLDIHSHSGSYGVHYSTVLAGQILTPKNFTHTDVIGFACSITTESQENGDWMSINWSNGKPNAGNYKIIINNEVTLNESVDGEEMTIMPAGKLTLNSGLSISDNVILKSDDTGDASLIGQANLAASGTITAERYISGYSSSSNGWHFLSSPVSNFIISGSDFAPASGTDDLYRWGEVENEWLNYTGGTFSHTEFEVGLGYLAAYSSGETKEFSGSLNASSKTKSLSYTVDQGEGWNLLGNPYPSAIDWSALTKTGDIDGSVYIVDPSDGSYFTWNGSTGDITNGEIAVNQAFFVKANSAGQTLTFETADQVHSTNDFNKSAKAAKETLKVSLKGQNSNNNTYLQFREDATTAFDHQIDAYKLFGFAEIAQVYTELEETQYAISCLSYSTETISVPLAIRVLADEALELNFSGMDSFLASIRIDLEDLKTGIITNIRTNPVYTFQATTADEANRFILHFNGVTAVENIEEAQVPLVYSFNNAIYIQANELKEADIFIYNINGQLVGQEKLKGEDLKRLDLKLSTGVYMISVQSAEAVYTEKVMIK